MKRTLLLILALTWLTAPASAEDERMVIELNTTQKTFVLGHMRGMLEALTDAQQLLLDGKREALRERISQLQSYEQTNRPKGLGRQLPPAFRAMAQSLRPHWQAMQDPALSEQAVRQHMADAMQVCNACHRTFSIK